MSKYGLYSLRRFPENDLSVLSKHFKDNGVTLDSSDKFVQTPEDVIRYKDTPEFLELLVPYEQQEIRDLSLFRRRRY